MATTTLPPSVRSYDSGDGRARTQASPAYRAFDKVMNALASLRLTVGLLAFGIFIVWIGTLAQTEADIWKVMRDYFRAWIMFVDLGLLFPPSFFTSLHKNYPGFFQMLDRFPVPMPGGMSVGVAMAVNLVAAHAWRFKIQSSGARLWGGVAVTAFGTLLTVLVILGGHNADGFQAEPPVAWSTIWYALLAAMVGVYVAGVGSLLMRLQQAKPIGNTVRSVSPVIGVAAVWGIGALLLVFAGGTLTTLGILTFLAAACGVVIPIGSGLSTRKASVGGIVAASLAVVGWLLLYVMVNRLAPAPEQMRILWQLMQGTAAGLVLLAGLVLIFRKRAGVVLLHLGVGLMMAGELFVSRYSVESQVTLREGETAHFSRDIRATELAIVDPSAKDTDDVVVIPGRLLERNARQNAARKAGDKPVFINDPQLPFQVAVLEYQVNHTLRDVKPGEKTVATAGRGLKEVLEPLPPARGTDTDTKTDVAGAYVQLADKDGKEIGTYLVSQLVEHQLNPNAVAETTKLGDTDYKLFLRFRRDYKPYSLTLLDVSRVNYLGTETAQSYSSDVRLVDKERGVDHEVHIWMNNPLRYAGETFYQSGHADIPGMGEVTTLSVVKNYGWMIPYVGCMLVVVGMCAHFLIALTRFLNRDQAVEPAVESELAAGDSGELVTPARSKKKSKKGKETPVAPTLGPTFSERWGLPILAVGLFVVIVGYYARPPKSQPRGMDYVAFGQLPVVESGRVKPFDTLARNSLRALAEAETVRDADDNKVSATEWLLDAVTGSDRALEYRIFRIDSPEVRSLFGLQQRKGNRYAPIELKDKVAQFDKEAKAASKLPTEQLTIYQRRLLQLHQRMRLYFTLVESFSPPRLPPPPTNEEMAANPDAGKQWMSQFQLSVLNFRRGLEEMKPPLPVPVTVELDSTKSEKRWKSFAEAWLDEHIRAGLFRKESDPFTEGYQNILAAYMQNDVQGFNSAVDKYAALLASNPPPDWNPRKVDFEAYFNHVSPFYVGSVLYVFGFVMALFGWLLRWKALNRAAFTLILLTFLFHTVALIGRIYISGRPPVTNLYSSAIFIGWGAVLFGLVFEAIYRLGLGNVLAAVTGFACLLISYFLAAGGDTISVLVAVLDTQFWLATHVVIVAMGYAATYVAGVLGLMYIILGVATPRLNAEMRKDVARMIYGTVCFAIFFSFFGTVLGGLWADDSWGRFWGWDPKENGALIIVMWNALVLHARWGKMIGDRGLAILAIGGNIVTSWSWFGVNELGIGLHNYGFTEGVLLALGLFVLSQLILIGVGLIPQRYWWSFTAEQQGAT